jgi:antitoxin component YwqK of YwqJK toxin-antitoxin module
MKYTLILSLLLGVLAHSQEGSNGYDAQGKRHGIWEKRYPGTQQLRYKGAFEHGKEVGTFRFYCETCVDQPSTVMEYQPDGSANVSYFTTEGHLVSTGSMRDKKRQGEWLYYHEGSNSIMMREHYEDDVLHGIKETYYPSGQITETQYFQNGVANGENRYYSPVGILIKKLMYVDGKLHGSAEYYDASGTLSISGTYKNGQKHGLWKYFEEGVLSREETFPKKFK